MITVEVPQGEAVRITLEGTDGVFMVDYDSQGEKKLIVTSDLPDSTGREGIIYEEDFSALGDNEAF